VVVMWRAHGGGYCTLLLEVTHGGWARSRPWRAYASRGGGARSSNSGGQQQPWRSADMGPPPLSPC
jgi:hypothetical protein